MEDRHLTSAAGILKSIHYITIATVCEDGSPWNSPVSATLDTDFTFKWGSNPENVHSQNIRRDNRVFVVIFDSTAPEGTGEGVYMTGRAEELEEENNSIKKYRFVPKRIWINDELKNEDGSYKHDIRIELDVASLKALLSK
jgi:general stress protein 26